MTTSWGGKGREEGTLDTLACKSDFWVCNKSDCLHKVVRTGRCLHYKTRGITPSCSGNMRRCFIEC